MIKVSTKLKRSQKGEFICLCRFDSCSACSFMVSVRKNVTQKKMTSKKKNNKTKKKKEKKKKMDTWMDLDWLISQFQVLPVFNWEVRYFTICWLDLTFYWNILYDVIYGYSLLSIPFTFNRSFGNFDTASVSAFKHSLCTFVPCKKILKLKVTHTHTHTPTHI